MKKYDIREKYLNKMISAKDTEFIKVITGVKRSGKSTLMLMYKEYLLNNDIKEENIIHVNFESAMYDDIKNRELRRLENKEDNYEKIILTMDKTINNDYNGIKVVNIIDFLLEVDK